MIITTEVTPPASSCRGQLMQPACWVRTAASVVLLPALRCWHCCLLLLGSQLDNLQNKTGPSGNSSMQQTRR